MRFFNWTRASLFIDARETPELPAKNGSVWSFLWESSDAYIFDSVKHGADKPLPEYIAVGLDTAKPRLLERRGRWNEPAPPSMPLPTEIWRETVERRSRYEKVRELISSGGITEVSDFITYNLLSVKADLPTRQPNLKKTLDVLFRKWDYDTNTVSDAGWEVNYMPFH